MISDYVDRILEQNVFYIYCLISAIRSGSQCEDRSEENSFLITTNLHQEQACLSSKPGNPSNIGYVISQLYSLIPASMHDFICIFLLMLYDQDHRTVGKFC